MPIFLSLLSNFQLQCRAKGGYLAEIDDQQENRFIETQAQFLGSAASISFYIKFANKIMTFHTTLSRPLNRKADDNELWHVKSAPKYFMYLGRSITGAGDGEEKGVKMVTHTF